MGLSQLMVVSSQETMQVEQVRANLERQTGRTVLVLPHGGIAEQHGDCLVVSLPGAHSTASEAHLLQYLTPIALSVGLRPVVLFYGLKVQGPTLVQVVQELIAAIGETGSEEVDGDSHAPRYLGDTA